MKSYSIAVALVSSMYLLSNVAMAAELGKSGIVDSFTFDHASSHFFEPDDTAGSEGTLFLQIGGIGDSTVAFSASWDWSGYSGSHPCALVDTLPHVFATDFVTGASPLFLSVWSSTADVLITHKSGAEIDAIITGGSVCEVLVPGLSGAGSNNEWYIAFEVTGGTKRFADASGTGTIHFFFDSGDGTFGINEVLVHMD